MISTPKHTLPFCTHWFILMVFLLILLTIQQLSHMTMALPLDSPGHYSCTPTQYPYGCTLIDSRGNGSKDGIVGVSASFEDCTAFEVVQSPNDSDGSVIYILDNTLVRKYIDAERKLMTIKGGTDGELDINKLNVIDFTRNGEGIYLIATDTSKKSVSMHYIIHFPLDGTAPRKLYSEQSLLFPSSMTAYKGVLYIANSAKYRIDKYDLASSTFTKGETLNSINVQIAPDSFVFATDELVFTVTKTRNLFMINLRTSTAIMITNHALTRSSVLQLPICVENSQKNIFFITKKTDNSKSLFTLYSLSYANIDTSKSEQNIKEWFSYTGDRKDGH
eukprot:Tbor_TRINITY_DN4918_c0_g2::TRINITY_DN4918_c0_g2_i1::g.9760::m.9760